MRMCYNNRYYIMYKVDNSVNTTQYGDKYVV